MTATTWGNRYRRAPWVRRIALLALVALQVCVAALPLTEAHRGSLVTHAEPDGAAHKFAVHDDANCAACSVRSLHAAPAVLSRLRPESPRHFGTPVQHMSVVRSWTGDPANPSRAPPAIG